MYANTTEEENVFYRANNELIAKEDKNGTVTYHHNDHLGSASIVTTGTGAMLEETRYYPYGEVRSGGDPTEAGKYQYTGQENDFETGLNYYGARYYNPGIGRFVQPDSMLPDMYDPQQLNRYVYVRNNPLKYIDPTGNEPVWGQLGNITEIYWEVKNGICSTDANIALNQLKYYFDSTIKYSRDSNNNLSISEQGVTRYIYTTKMGWIDMRHFFAAAEATSKMGAKLTEIAGYFYETKQGNASNFSYEDLPSNHAGAKFWNEYGSKILSGDISIQDAVMEFLNNQGAVAPEEAPNYEYITYHTTLDGSYTQVKSKSRHGYIGDNLKGLSKANFDKLSQENQKKIKEAHNKFKH